MGMVDEASNNYEGMSTYEAQQHLVNNTPFGPFLGAMFDYGVSSGQMDPWRVEPPEEGAEAAAAATAPHQQQQLAGDVAQAIMQASAFSGQISSAQSSPRFWGAAPPLPPAGSDRRSASAGGRRTGLRGVSLSNRRPV